MKATRSGLNVVVWIGFLACLLSAINTFFVFTFVDSTHYHDYLALNDANVILAIVGMAVMFVGYSLQKLEKRIFKLESGRDKPD